MSWAVIQFILCHNIKLGSQEPTPGAHRQVSKKTCRESWAHTPPRLPHVTWSCHNTTMQKQQLMWQGNPAEGKKKLQLEKYAFLPFFCCCQPLSLSKDKQFRVPMHPILPMQPLRMCERMCQVHQAWGRGRGEWQRHNAPSTPQPACSLAKFTLLVAIPLSAVHTESTF